MLAILLAAAATFSMTPQWAQISSDDENCLVQKDLPWCGGAIGSKPLTSSALLDAEQDVYKQMKFVDKRSAVWTSFHRQVAQGRRVEGDCDNFVFTVLGRLASQGYDVSGAMRLLVTNDPKATKPNHMVALVKLDGNWVVFADTEAARPYEIGKAKWRPIYSAPINETKWYFVQS